MSRKPMGRPKVENPNVINKSVKLNKEMIDKINDYGKEKGLSFSKVIRLALEEFFK